MSDTKTARTYNQNHVPRKYTPGRRRVSMYISWSYPAEAGRNPSELDNRFSTMTEVRRVAWPPMRRPVVGPVAVPAGNRGSAGIVLLGLGAVPAVCR